MPQDQNTAARSKGWLVYPNREDETEGATQQDIWGSSTNTHHTSGLPTMETPLGTTGAHPISPESTSASPQHRVPYHAPYQLPSPPPNQYTNSSSTAWGHAIPVDISMDISSTTEEEEDPQPVQHVPAQPVAAAPMAMVITPDKPTPSRSNVKYRKQPRSLRVKRGLHNSHRKQRLHHIRPIKNKNYSMEGGQDPYRHDEQSTQQPQQQQQHRGNGCVLDLTSLFSPSSETPKTASTETATTAASTQQQHHQQQQQPDAFNPIPPWKLHNHNKNTSLSIGNASVTSTTTPVNNNLHHHFPAGMEDMELQWDTKSQTTQEALLTERQCQALTQWLNFALVGEQQQHQQQDNETQSSLATPRRRRAQAPARQRLANHPEEKVDEHDEFEDGLTLTNTGSWSTVRATTPTRKQQPRSTTPTSIYCTTRSTASKGGGGGRPTTPTSTKSSNKRATTPTSSTKSNRLAVVSGEVSTNKKQRGRKERRLSMFQYAQSYDHAHEQARHWFVHSTQWKELRMRIRSEVSNGKLTLREDRNLYANIGCREQILSLLLSYRPAWLTLALEVVMNESLPLHHTGSTVHGGASVVTATSTLHPHHSSSSLPSTKQLKEFIVHRVLSDETLLSKYNQGRGSRVPSGQFEESYLAEMRSIVLYRILVLVFFLDRAAGKYQSSLGNLFHATTTSSSNNNKSNANNNPLNIKSTSQVLVYLCKEFLSRQGDIVKQLARVNLHAFHKQSPLDEIELPIVNFAIDLRDGVRLCRLVEVLWLNSGDGNNDKKYPLLSVLRIPAISRLQKIHNVNVALTALQEKCQIGLPREMQAHHIVDGQRRMVLRLIWTIVLMHCFEKSSLLTQRQLEAEIADIQGLLRHYERRREKRRERQLQELQQRQQSSALDLMEQEAGSLDSSEMLSHSENNGDSSLVEKGKQRAQALTLFKERHKTNKAYTAPYMSLSRSSSFDAEDSVSCNSNILLEEVGAVQQWKGLLMQWCDEVCKLVEDQEAKADSVANGSEPTRPLNNLSSGRWTTVDLTNGKALCCLIHHYHPTLLPREELRLTSTVIDGPPTRIETSQGPVTPHDRSHKGRRQQQKPKIAPDYHIRLAHKKLCELGGIPSMMLMPLSTPGKHHKRTTIAPLAEEKSILVHLYHVCARLLESRHQVQSILFVQQRYRFLCWVTLQKEKRRASQIIWMHWQAKKDNYFRAQKRKYGRAVIIIEAFTRRHRERLSQLQVFRVERERQRKAVLPIQMRARIFLAAKRYRFMLGRRDAAITIQSKYRQFQEYVSYQLLLLEVIPATTTIQRHWRGYVQREGYAALIEAVIRMQSFTRGAVLVRKTLMRSWYNAATCMQKLWRGFWVQMHYQLDLLDIVTVQCLVRKQQSKQAAKRRTDSVAVLQRAGRVFLARLVLLRLKLEKRATVRIQCTWRRYVAIREAAKIRAMIALGHATLVIQRSWRRTLFLRERRAASTQIQTQYRRWYASRYYSSLLEASTKVQTQWRRYVNRKNYVNIHQSIVAIQATFRRWIYGVVSVTLRRLALQKLQNAARCMLAARALKAKRQYRKDAIEKAIVCQSLVRTKACLDRFELVRNSISLIQAKWCMYRWIRNVRRKAGLLSALATCDLLCRFSQKGSFKIVPRTKQVVLLDKRALVRCGQKEIAISNVSSTCVLPWRGHRQKLFWHRSHVKDVRLKYASGTQLEHLIRRKVSLKMLRSINQAAVALQAPWLYAHDKVRSCDSPKASRQRNIARRLANRRVSRARKVSAAAVRTLVERSTKPEGTTTSNKMVRTALKRASDVVALPRSSGATAARQHIRSTRTLNLIRRNTTLSSDKSTRSTGPLVDPFKETSKKEAAVVIIQKLWRCFAARCLLAKRNVDRRQSVTVRIQSVARMWLATRRQNRVIISTTKIQCNWRGLAQRTKFHSTIRGIVALQSMARMLQPKQRLSRGKSSAVRIQQTARRWLAGKKVIKLKALKEMRLAALQEDHAAAIRIQNAWRGFICRADFMYSLLCLIKLQSWWRGMLEHNAYERVSLATIALQSIGRGFNSRKRLGRTRTYATVIQAHFRGYCARMLLRSHQASATTLQRHARGLLDRQRLSLQQFAATEIQKAWRGYQDAVGYIIVVVSAIKIQSFSRMLAAKKVKSKLAARDRFWNDCATTIQSSWRVLKAKRRKAELQRLYDASVKIQSHVRRVNACRQVNGRKNEVKENNKQANHAATRIQCLARKKLARMTRVRLFEQKESEPVIIKFQAIVRRVLALLAQRKRQRAAVRVQSAMRMALAMRCRAGLAAKKQFIGSQKQQDETRAAVQAKVDASQSSSIAEKGTLHRRLSLSQGMVRGFLIRRQQSNPEIRKSISLIKEAELRSKLDPSMRLGARMDRALTLLKSSSSLTEIMNIVCTLELATRFSKECCEEFVQAHATEILVALLCDCNKSLPHVELLYYIMCTLSNVSKHKSLIQDVTRKEAAEAFLYLIRMYGSEDAIFCSAVALLEMCAMKNKEVQELIATPTSRRRLEGAHKTWAKKLQTKVVKESPFKVEMTPKFVRPKQRGKAKTDMLILGVSYDLNRGVSALERVLSLLDHKNNNGRMAMNNNKNNGYSTPKKR